jgi:hypothetical protein
VDGSGDDATFIATSEMSVGAFMDIIATAGKWDEVRTMLPRTDAGGIDPRTGPRTWTWSGSAMALTRTAGPGDLAGGWVRIKTQMSGREYYPAGVTVEPPSRDHPMQYLSPQAAILAARLAGCRLPTSEEWKAAGGGVEGGTGTNRRDASWKRVHEHLRQFASSGPEFPGSGIFWPTGISRRSPLEDGEPAIPGDDGMVWFAPVGAGGTGSQVLHLVGNVAEYTFEQPAMLEGLATTKEAIDAAVGRGEQLRIVGGSALSPFEVEPATPYPVTAAMSREGFSDVGFRLAFGAPKAAAAAGVAERLRTALAECPYQGPGEGR